MQCTSHFGQKFLKNFLNFLKTSGYESPVTGTNYTIHNFSSRISLINNLSKTQLLIGLSLLGRILDCLRLKFRERRNLKAAVLL